MQQSRIELIKTEKTKDATVYYFKTNSPIEVDYQYGYNAYVSEVTLSISFSDTLTDNEKLLRSSIIVNNINSPIIQKSHLGKLKGDFNYNSNCFYAGSAIVELNEIGLFVPDQPSGMDAWANISKIHITSVPNYECED